MGPRKINYLQIVYRLFAVTETRRQASTLTSNDGAKSTEVLINLFWDPDTPPGMTVFKTGAINAGQGPD
jgi:hypothetical protein